MKEQIFGILIAILTFILFFALGGLVGCWLWDAIMVAVFGLPSLSFWQMYGLIWLTHIILPWNVSTSRD